MLVEIFLADHPPVVARPEVHAPGTVPHLPIGHPGPPAAADPAAHQAGLVGDRHLRNGQGLHPRILLAPLTLHVPAAAELLEQQRGDLDPRGTRLAAHQDAVALHHDADPFVGWAADVAHVEASADRRLPHVDRGAVAGPVGDRQPGAGHQLDPFLKQPCCPTVSAGGIVEGDDRRQRPTVAHDRQRRTAAENFLRPREAFAARAAHLPNGRGRICLTLTREALSCQPTTGRDQHDEHRRSKYQTCRADRAAHQVIGPGLSSFFQGSFARQHAIFMRR